VTDPPTESGHFRSPYLRCVYGIPIALFGLLGLSAASTGSGGLAFAVLFALLCWFLAVRAFRMGVSYSSNGVVVRNYLRTHRWPWSDIASFHVGESPVGAMACRRRVLEVVLITGQMPSFGQQNASPRNRSTPCWIESAVVDLNRELIKRT
jgi:hypothetical protein